MTSVSHLLVVGWAILSLSNTNKVADLKGEDATYKRAISGCFGAVNRPLIRFSCNRSNKIKFFRGMCLSYPVPSVTLAYCGQTAGWIKMPLGTEVRLGGGHIVLDMDLTPLPH